MWKRRFFYFLFGNSFNLWFLIRALYHQSKITINFWYRQRLNHRSLILPSETLLVKLTETHEKKNRKREKEKRNKEKFEVIINQSHALAYIYKTKFSYKIGCNFQLQNLLQLQATTLLNIFLVEVNFDKSTIRLRVRLDIAEN